MIKKIHQLRQFKRDLKRVAKQGKDLRELYQIVSKLANNQPLEFKHKEHLLSNNWAGCQECHIRPNWLLIYKVDDESIVLCRTASHSALFKK